MRAAVVREFNEDLSIEQVDDPACPENGVVLDLAACGVCGVLRTLLTRNFHQVFNCMPHQQIDPAIVLKHVLYFLCTSPNHSYRWFRDQKLGTKVPRTDFGVHIPVAHRYVVMCQTSPIWARIACEDTHRIII